jgi:holin-like protein
MLPFLQLIGCQLVGESVQRLSGIPIPGPVIGMLILLAALIARGGPSAALESSSRSLLKHLPILFVPAGVGIVAHLELIRTEWLPIMGGVLGSSVIAILATAGVMRAVERLRHPTEGALQSPVPAIESRT